MSGAADMGTRSPAETTAGPPGSGPGRNAHLGHGVRVGLLDTRMFPDPWLTGRYVARPDDILNPEQRRFTVFDGHCAFVGSCILQQAPAAEIHVRSVLDSDNDGSAWDAAIAMAEIAQARVDVVNLSFGEVRTDDNSAPMVLQAAVKRFSPETVVVAAAGNNGDVRNHPSEAAPGGIEPNSASYPAALVERGRSRRTRSKWEPRRIHPASRSLDCAASTWCRAYRSVRAGHGHDRA